jgi:dihydrolipoamide dehydrogenase
MSQYDVIVIGGGPAGYPCAIRAGQNKLKVACIDEWQNKDGSYAFGGTCLNAGCIPSKAMLESSELFHRAQHEFAVHGVKVGSVELDLAAMQKRRAQIVKQSTLGIAGLFKGAGVTGLQGHGKLLSGNRVEFTNKDGKKEELTAKHVVLAAGSAPIELKSLPASSASSSAASGDVSVQKWSCSKRSTRSCLRPMAPYRRKRSSTSRSSGSTFVSAQR